jgi:hypothetical protein
MQSGEALFELFAKRFDAFTINPTSPVIGSDALPRDLQVLRLVDFVDERVNLSYPYGEGRLAVGGVRMSMLAWNWS